MAKTDLSTVGVEVLKTVGGFMGGRMAVIMAEKALKVPEELDDKKKKFKEVGVGVAVAAVGTIAAMKVPDNYKSIAAGFASAGAISAISPFGKEDQGFIPVLHGNMGMSALSSADYTQEDYLNEQMSALASTESEEDEVIRELNALSAADEYEDAQEVTDVASEVN